MDIADIKAVLDNDYDAFRDVYYKDVENKFNENPIALNFMKCMENNRKICQCVNDIKNNIKGINNPPQQMLLDGENCDEDCTDDREE